jgi:hypothetical protein
MIYERLPITTKHNAVHDKRSTGRLHSPEVD